MTARLAPAWRSALAACLLGLCVLVPRAGTAAPVPAEATTAEARQILVMLRLPAQHYRPGSTYGGYYDDEGGARSRRVIAAGVARRHGLVLIDTGWPMPSLGVDCYVMEVPAGQSVDDAIARVSRDRDVAWSQPMNQYEAKGRVGNVSAADPLFAAEPAASLWDLAGLHRLATGRGATVAVIDSKVDARHPDLAGQFVADMDFVSDRPHAPEVHGTAVAAVIAAKAGNGVGIAGIAPAARLMALRACWQTGGALSAPTLCNSLGLARALDFAIGHSAHIINMSLGGPPDRLLAQLIGLARKRQIAIVAAYDPKLPGGGFPASMAGVIAVTDDCALASAARKIYCAPGDGIPTARPGDRWFLANGSSFAAAHVSGLIALMRERRSPAADVAFVSRQPEGGMLDACAALLAGTGRRGCAAMAAQ